MNANFDSRVKIFLNDEVEFSSLSKNKIEKLLSLDDISEIIILPDIHSKPDNPFPTGIVTLTSNTIYPFVIGQGIGCGMRLLKTSLNSEDINDDVINSLFTSLKSSLQDGKKKSFLFSRSDYLKILAYGPKWAKEKFDIEKASKADLSKIYETVDGAVKDKDIISAIPKDALWGGYYKLGSLGGGNHFLEMQVVDEILDETAAKRCGLSKGQVLFMFHTDSGGFAKRLDNYYGIRFESNRKDKEFRKNFRKLLFHFSDLHFYRFPLRWDIFFGKSFRGIPADSKEGKRYMLAVRAAMNYSFVNRSIISWFIQNSLNQLVKKNFSIQFLSDTTHECINYEEFNGKGFWVHRNGAIKVNYRNSQEEEVLPLPGFMGGPSFLSLAQKEIINSRYSVNHGAGRIFTKQEAKIKFTSEDIYTCLKEKNIRLYKLGNEDIREQAPHAFKDIYAVAKALKGHNLVRPIVMIRPLAILKG